MFSLFNSLERLFASATSTPNRSVSEGRTSRRRKSPNRPGNRRLRLERLEERTVFNASYDSVTAFGSSSYDAAFDVATDTSGNAYSTGYFSGTVDFDPAATHAGDTDIRTATGARDVFVMKKAPDGSLLWVTQMPGTEGTSLAFARSIAVDAAGNAYVAGDFSRTMSAGSTMLTSDGNYDAFVAKLAPDGNVAWAARYGGLRGETVDGVAVDSSGNVLTAGYTFLTTPDGASYSNIQIAKFSPSGSQLWLKQLGNSTATGNATDIAHAVAADGAGNVYIAGRFHGTVDFDPGSGTRNVSTSADGSGFVLKLTPSGGFTWVSPFLGQTAASKTDCKDLAVDGSGNIVVGGYYRGPVDFDPSKKTKLLPYYSDTSGGGFIAKLNSAGSLSWVQPVGYGGGYAGVEDLALDAAGNVYVTGMFQLQLDFNPGSATNYLRSNGVTDVFVAKFSSSGSYAWAVSFGGSWLDQATGIAVDKSGDIYVAGLYSETVDFDPSPLTTSSRTSSGENDGFLLKLKQL